MVLRRAGSVRRLGQLASLDCPYTTSTISTRQTHAALNSLRHNNSVSQFDHVATGTSYKEFTRLYITPIAGLTRMASEQYIDVNYRQALLPLVKTRSPGGFYGQQGQYDNRR